MPVLGYACHIKLSDRSIPTRQAKPNDYHLTRLNYDDNSLSVLPKDIINVSFAKKETEREIPLLLGINKKIIIIILF